MAMKEVADPKKMVKVRVLAEQMSYTDSTGSNSRKNFMRGDVLLMEEDHALAAAEGVDPRHKDHTTTRQARAAVEILGSADVVDGHHLSAPRAGERLDPEQVRMDAEIAKAKQLEKARLAAEAAEAAADARESDSAF